MKKALLLILILSIFQIPVFAAPKKFIPQSSSGKDDLPNIFIYSIPEHESERVMDTEENNENDYVTESQENEGEEIVLEPENVMISATTLKGYAQYVEDVNSIYLKDDNDEYVLNLKVPQKIIASEGMNLKKTLSKKVNQYIDDEYKIAPKNINTSDRVGDFTFGATYGTEVDNIAMLEKQTGLFTKYEREKFALSSSVKKSLNTTYAQDYNTISLTPEFKLNKYMSLKNVLSADITRNRRSSKLVFSLNPFAKTDDRLELQFGAKQTIYLDNDFVKNEFSFSTLFKL